MAKPSTEPIPKDLREAFHNAVWLYSDWTPSDPEPNVRVGMMLRSITELCNTTDQFHDDLPDDVFDKLMSYMGGIRYTLIRQKLAANKSYAAAARCFLRLIEDRKTFGKADSSPRRSGRSRTDPT